MSYNMSHIRKERPILRNKILKYKQMLKLFISQKIPKSTPKVGLYPNERLLSLLSILCDDKYIVKEVKDANCVIYSMISEIHSFFAIFCSNDTHLWL
jgi:hypothetical protein